MSRTDAQRYYDRVAGGYDESMRTRADLALREAVWGAVLSRSRDGEVVLDYGCGTGTDARHYAAAGRRVIAYDPSAGMLAELRQKCAAHIDAGRIVACAEVGRLGREIERAPPAVLTLTFGVLNLMPDPRSLADTMDRCGSLRTVVLTVLNPFRPGDLTRPWWWRGAVCLPRGYVDCRVGAVRTRRYTVRALRRLFEPAFRLVSVFAAIRGRTYRHAPLNRLGTHLGLVFSRPA